MTRVKAVILDGPASAETIAQIRAELAGQDCTIVVAPPSIRDIISRVCFEMGVPTGVILSDQRGRHVSRARFAISWLARRVTQKTLPIIGEVLGGRDHSTIVHAVRRADELRAQDPAFRALTDRLISEFADPLWGVS